MTKDGYTVVGSICKPNESQISLDEAEELRTTLVKDFFGHVPTTIPQEKGHGIVTRAMHGSYGLSSYDAVPTMLTGASLHVVTPHTWRMLISQAKLRRTYWNQAQQRVATYLRINVEDDHVTEAVRRVKIIRGVGSTATTDSMSEYDRDVYNRPMQRRTFEHPMTSIDCYRAAHILRRPLHL